VDRGNGQGKVIGDTIGGSLALLGILRGISTDYTTSILSVCCPVWVIDVH